MNKNIVIVGGGFCGTLAAVRLLRKQTPQRFRIVLIERSPLIARGVAYGAALPCHRLNVPAARMSALGEDENHFLNFARGALPALDGGDFAPRSLYGDYLGWLLEQARAANDRHDFTRIQAAVVDIENAGGGARVILDDGTALPAARVILAFGNAGARDPAFAQRAGIAGDPRYIADPWAPAALDRVDRARPALLVGSGLTAVDMAIGLRERGFAQPLHALSRHGLLPIAHRATHRQLDLALPPQLRAQPLRVRDAMRTLRRYAAALGRENIDWRDVMVALRPLTPELWRALDDAERGRFLRHAQAYWEVFRHRLAPAVAEPLHELLRSRALMLHAGRIAAIAPVQDGLEIRFRRRGERSATSVLRAGTVINCTGMNGDIGRSADPLLQALRKRGLIRPDAHRIGVATDDAHALLDAQGTASRTLFYVGPLLKAGFWEATAVPELREHVTRLVDGVF